MFETAEMVLHLLGSGLAEMGALDALTYMLFCMHDMRIVDLECDVLDEVATAVGAA